MSSQNLKSVRGSNVDCASIELIGGSSRRELCWKWVAVARKRQTEALIIAGQTSRQKAPNPEFETEEPLEPKSSPRTIGIGCELGLR